MEILCLNSVVNSGIRAQKVKGTGSETSSSWLILVKGGATDYKFKINFLALPIIFYWLLIFLLNSEKVADTSAKYD
jgi:hypothetical protein